MKHVILFRHGKSDWYADYGHDHERPLAERGRRASEDMGRWLAAQGPVPDHVLCSTATRARQTFARANKAGPWKAPVSYHDSLYGAYPEQLLDLICEQPDALSCVMLVGHQPTWSMTTAMLAGVEVPHFPTATMACIAFQTDHWVEVTFGAGTLLWLQRPKALKP